MAKAKKKEVLSQEEKLEQALIPVDEQPYEVPKNWCWVKLESIKAGADCFFDGDWILGENMNPEGEVRLLQLSDIGIGDFLNKSDKHISQETFEQLGCTSLKAGDVMISRMAEPIARSCIVPEFDYTVITAVDVAVLRCNNNYINNKYVNYLCNAKWFTDKAMSMARGTTRTRITRANLGTMPFPLPPLAEQQRIVEQIESLFAKLDEAKDKAQNVIECYENTVSAILHRVFTGELSKKWRESNGKTKDAWCSKKINEVCVPRAGYAFDSKKFQSTGCQIIRMGNLYGGVLDLSRSPVFIDESELDDGIIKRAKIHDGDILITLTGTKYKRDYGYAVCLENPVDLYVNQRILCLSPNPNIDTNYLLYYLRSNMFRDIFFSNETGGVNQGNVSSKFVENIELQIPTIEEQRVIAIMLKDILTKEEQAKELAETVVQQIDLMKKSILAKAFRGELGTNNTDEESAVELLKQILVENL